MNLKEIYNKNFIKRYSSLLIAELIAAINFNLLLKPINLVAGGTPGLSLILEKTFHIDTTIIIAIAYVITFFISFLFLGKASLGGLLFASIVYPLFVSLTDNIISLIVIDYQDILLISIFSGLVSGISTGLIYKNGFPSSGIGVIAPILNKYFKFSISTVNFVINTIIVLVGGYYFGIEMILYAIILLYISSYISNIIILGVSYDKAIIFNSSKNDEINEYIRKNLNTEPTILKAKGGFENKKQEMELVVIPTIKYHLLKENILRIDRNIFFVTCNSYEVQNKKVL